MPQPISLAALKEAAEKATSGPYREIIDYNTDGLMELAVIDVDADDNGRPVHSKEPICLISDTSNMEENAEFLLACSPETILALIRAVEAAIDVLQSGRDGEAARDDLAEALKPFGE